MNSFSNAFRLFACYLLFVSMFAFVPLVIAQDAVPESKPASSAPANSAAAGQAPADAPKPAVAPAAADAAPTPAASPEPTPTIDPEEELRRLAITDLSQVDADYHDQGEYAGTISLHGGSMPVGLQVMALGGGNFAALFYHGGLPGSGYNCSRPMKLSGSRSGDQIKLTGEQLTIYLQTGFAATVKTTAGQRLGFLQPVKRVSVTMGANPLPMQLSCSMVRIRIA